MHNVSTVVQQCLAWFGLRLTRAAAGIWDTDQEFLALYREIQSHTLVKIDRCYMLYQFARHAATLNAGHAAQLGIYKGGTAKLIARCFSRAGRRVYLFDTFEGLPPFSPEDQAENQPAGQFADVRFEDVKNYLANESHVELRRGMFPGTAQGLEGQRFSFVYLDADIYQSTKDGLEFFYPRMVPGGIIILDDYHSRYWPGVARAVEELRASHDLYPIKSTWWQGVLICGANPL
jgi:O-methyltransferase